MPAPDVEYVFDAAVELCDITADAHFYFMNIHPNANAWMDDHEGLRTALLCKSITDDYFEWYQDAPVEEADAATIAGLRASKFQLKQIVENLSYIIIDDVCHRGHTGRRGFRKAQAMSTIKTIVHCDRSFLNYFELWRQLIARASTMGTVRFHAAAREYGDLIERNNARRRQAIRDRVSIHETRLRLNKNGRARQKKNRKVMTKSFNLLAEITGLETAKAFVGGDAITIEGKAFDFRCRRGGSLFTTGHGSARVEIVDKSGVVLTDLCVYFDDMPAMDQVAALALHAMVGNEKEILQIGNFFNVRAEGYTSPLLNIEKPRQHSRLVLMHDYQQQLWKKPVEAAVERFLRTRLGRSAAYVFDNLTEHNPGRDYELVGV